MPIKSRVFILLPAYQPESALLELCYSLLRADPARTVVVVNDGSSANYQPVFDAVAQVPGVELLVHKSNRGKGAALKTAFKFVSSVLGADDGHHIVVTCDADGQHAVPDVEKLIKAATLNSNALFIGARQFDKAVPLRSRLGNILTRWILWAYGFAITDTQSGLRALPAAWLTDLLNIRQNRYEFETEMLFLLKNRGRDIQEIPISTIYINDNQSSHFRPLVDSLRIYFVLMRFICASKVSFVLDIVLFSLFVLLGAGIIEATYSARIFSGIFNFIVNKYIVFRDYYLRRLLVESLCYIVLAVFIATASAYSVYFLDSRSNLPVVVLKILVDTILFFVSFLVQRYFIFYASIAGSADDVSNDGRQ